MSGKEIRSILGQNLKIYRNKREWSQEDLAEAAGLSIPFLSAIERGAKWPYPDTLFKLSYALNIDVWELFKPYKKESETMSISEDEKIKFSRFANDITLALNNSIIHAMKQSMENVRERYFD